MRKWLKRTVIIAISLLILASGAFFVYVSDYYRATDAAMQALANRTAIKTADDMIVFTPDAPTDTALIFYPGGKVEYTAYIPLLEQLRQGGIACVLVKMPYNLAVLNVNAADKAYAALPEIKRWYIGGHSLGGVMASSYAASHKNRIQGVVLLGAYVYGDVSPKTALTVYGSEDGLLDRSKITYSENVHVIQGGNHVQFGSYGEQKGDGKADITGEEQRRVTAELILQFINR